MIFKFKYVIMFSLIISLHFYSFSQEKVTLSGYVKDASNGEVLIGSTVLINNLGNGSTTNVYGFYSLTIPKGTYQIEYRYIGYNSLTKSVDLTSDLRLDIELSEENVQLNEVVVTGERMDENVTSVQMSVNKLDQQTIKKVPAFAGEVDVIKAIQFLPGISTVGEGASGFNSRGGSVGQNLILLDEAPVYQSSHLFGFFSVFNPDAVKDIKLYKGSVPAQYGGRLSSILDIRMKEGNSKKWDGGFGAGTVFSRGYIEGPIVKDKASFLIAARRSYADLFVKAFTDVLSDGAGLYFYDLTAKANYNINENNRIYVSGYFGRDVFKFDAQQGFNWGNSTFTTRWNHLFNEKLFSNTTLVLSNYDYAFQFGEDDQDNFSWESQVLARNLKEELTYFVNTKNEISAGVDALLYEFRPADAVGYSDGEKTDISLAKKYSLELSGYISNQQTISEKLTLVYGIRFSSNYYLGDGKVYYYENGEVGKVKDTTYTETYEKGEIITSYFTPEPRVSFKYQLNQNTSIKGGFMRTAQYVHLMSNTAAVTPIDVWTPSTNNIKPQTGNQYSLGLFKNFGGEKVDYESSIEIYYRTAANQIEYVDNANLFINELFEGELLFGIGRAYGAEFYAKKNNGKLNGWIAYTLAKTEVKVDGFNSGEWFATRYDQRHNLKLAAFYQFNSKWEFGADFVYITGTPTTLPNQRFDVQGYTIPLIIGDARNNVRIADYHRLDLTATLTMSTRSSLAMTIYNVYARKNAFAWTVTQDAQTSQTESGNSPVATSITETSILGTIFPSLMFTYNF